jgi:hypothetical protein
MQRNSGPAVISAALVQPSIAAFTHPGHRYRADVGSLANQIGDDPVLLSLLKVLHCEVRDLAAPQTTRQHYRQNCASRRPLRLSTLGARRRERLCSPVSLFPSLTPIFLAPFTRRMPAAKSGLSSVVPN